MTENSNLENTFKKIIDEHGLMVSVFTKTDLESTDDHVIKFIKYIKSVDSTREKWTTGISPDNLKNIHRNP